MLITKLIGTYLLASSPSRADVKALHWLNTSAGLQNIVLGRTCSLCLLPEQTSTALHWLATSAGPEKNFEYQEINKMNKVLIFIVIALAVVLAGCSPAAPTSEPTNAPTEPGAEETSIPEIAIDAADFSYTAPETVNAGWVRVKLTNNGKEPHHVQFLRLNDEVTLEAFQEALQQGPGAEMTLSKLMGGVGQIAPTGSAQAVLNLTAGEYVIICFVPSGDEHVPHLAKGMIKPLTVLEAGAAAATEPIAELTVTMKDYLIDFPETLPAGPRIIKVVNNGPDVHELNLLRLEDGKTVEDVTQFLAAPDGPPPFVPIGGMNGLDSGASGYMELDLEPGTYVAICYIPTPKSEGHPHFTRGMIKEFTVQ